MYVRDMNGGGSCRPVIVGGNVGYTVDHVSDISPLASTSTATTFCRHRRPPNLNLGLCRFEANSTGVILR